MPRTVVVTGLGAITALGRGVGLFWEALKEGRSGIRQISFPPAYELKVALGAEVPGFDPAGFFRPEDLPLLDRFSQFAVVAAREAVTDAGLTQAEIGDAAGIIGTGCGGKQTDEETYQRLYQRGKSRAHPLTIPKGMPSAAASQVSIQVGVRGPVFSIASACSSAAHAIGQGLMMIRSGLVDVAIVGGTDAPFTYGLMKSWVAMRVLSPDGCRPFSADRNGLVLGEGAAMLVLESVEHAEGRGAKIYAELAGCGMSADAGHITDPSAEGAARAIRMALEDAGMAPEEVGYVNAHGTGTRVNDLVETRVLRAVFGPHANSLKVSSTKSMHGHTLGAAGAMELAATVLALHEGVIPPTINFTEPDEKCDLDYVPNQAQEFPVKAAISNSFAFGGLNAALAVRLLAKKASCSNSGCLSRPIG